MERATSPNDAQGQPWCASLYEFLHALAASRLKHESDAASLQATLLANDAYMAILKQANVQLSNRDQSRSAGAQIIRRSLIDHARARSAKKRRGESGRPHSLSECEPTTDGTLELLDLHDALNRLGQLHPRAAQAVELRFFGGLTGDEIAIEQNVSLATVNKDWSFAKAWLYKELGWCSDAK